MHTVGRLLSRALRRAVPVTLVAAATLVAVPGLAAADPGELDPTYGSAGVATLDYGPSPYGSLADTIDLPGGGYYGAIGGWSRIVKFDAAGVADPAYGDGGVAQAQGGIGSVVGLAPDGSLVYADRSWNGSRVLPGGSQDPAFTFARPSQYVGTPTTNGQPKLLSGVGSVAVTSDGSIHVLGIGARCDTITPPPPPPQPTCVMNRYHAEMIVNPDQTIAVRFVGAPLGGSPTQGASPRASIVLPDDSIVAGRQNAGGLIHMTTGSVTSIGSTSVVDLAADAAGNVLAATVQSGRLRTTRAIVNPATDTIALDTTFGTSGFADVDVTSVDPAGALASSAHVLPLADGRVVVGGAAGAHAVLARLSAAGAVDGSFGTGGLASVTFPYQWAPSRVELGALRSVGSGIVVLGTLSDPTPMAMYEARFDSDGALDPSFGGVGFSVTRPWDNDQFGFPTPRVLVAADGTITSAWSAGSGLGLLSLGRVRPDGTPDPSFGTNGVIATTIEMEANSIAFDPAGRIIVVGRTADGATSGTAVIARFSPNGQLDTTFGAAGFVTMTTSASFQARQILFDAAGRILVLTDTGVRVFDATGAPDPAYPIPALDRNVVMWLNADATLTVARSTLSGGAEWWNYRPDGSLTGFAVNNDFRPEGFVPTLMDGTGKVTMRGSSSGRPVIGRVDARGNLDPTFGGAPSGPPGMVYTDTAAFAPLGGVNAIIDDGVGGYYASDLAEDPDTGLLVTSVGRLTEDAQLDLSFGDGGRFLFPTIPQMTEGWLFRVPRGLLLTRPGDVQTSAVVQLEPTDATAPVVTIASPADGADYSIGQVVAADYSCTDTGGSGVASCAGPVASGTAIDTASAGPKSFTVTASDVAGNPASATVGYDVLAGDVSATVVGPQVLDTDPGGVGASPAVPLQTRIDVPAGVSGSISVVPQPAGPPPAGFVLFDRQATITGPVAPSPAAPYALTFTLDAGSLGAFTPADVDVFRNGVAVANVLGRRRRAGPLRRIARRRR